jgi:hypothetical protein
MNAPARPDGRRETGPVEQRRAHPGVGAAPQEPCPETGTPPGEPVGRRAHDGGDFETCAGAGV